MAVFTGTGAADDARASTGVLTGFTGGSLAELQDNLGDVFDALLSNDTVVAGNGDDTINGGGGDDSLDGGVGNDVITDTVGVNQLFGGNGDDIFNVGGGQATIAGGAGFDEVNYGTYLTPTQGVNVQVDVVGNGTAIHYTSAGTQIVDTLTSIERITGTQFADTIIGGADSETVAGGAGADRVYGEAAAAVFGSSDALYGGDGNDTLFGGLGFDTLDGGAGSDTADYSTHPYFENNPVRFTVSLDSAGNGRADSATFPLPNGTFNEGQDDVLFAIENVIGGDASDIFNLQNATGRTIAGGPNGWGAPTNSVNYNYNGPLGNFESTTGIVAELGNGPAPASGQDRLVAIGSVIGSAFGDMFTVTDTDAHSISGGAGNDTLTGGNGVDTLNGDAGDDIINGGLGADSMSGGTGSDAYYVEVAGDIVVEQADAGNDTVYFRNIVGATLGANVENGFALATTASLTGNAGDNTLIGGYARVAVTLTGGDGNDYLSGTPVSDTLYGGNGSDVLYGRAGGDLMFGGDGSDSYYVDSLSDIVTENSGAGAGSNDIIYTSIDITAPTNVETIFTFGAATNVTGNDAANAMLGVYSTQGVTLSGAGGNDQIYGSNFADALNGGADNDTMYGDAGSGDGAADTMSGGSGNDTYFVKDAVDVVSEAVNEGTDVVYAATNYTLLENFETLFIYGSATSATGNGAANAVIGSYIATGATLDGAGGNDTVIGGAGDDTVIGGAGVDALTGASGNDEFRFSQGQANGDTVIDFAGNGAGAGDSLRFSGYGAGATFTQIGATNQWVITYNGGASTETIRFSNNAAIDASDYIFV